MDGLGAHHVWHQQLELGRVKELQSFLEEIGAAISQISVCVHVAAASEAKNICPNENLMEKGLFKALLGTSSKGCAEQLLTRVGFSGAAGELFTGRESFKKHTVGGSCLQFSLCLIPLSRDGGGVILKSLMCLREG